METTRSSDHVDESLTTGYHGRILLLVVLCSLIANLAWLVLPPLLPEIMSDLDISSSQAGFALTTLTLLAALGRYPGGRMADQLSRKTVIVFCILLWIVGCILLTFVVEYWMFLLGVSALGFGLGMFVPAAFAQLSDLFTTKQGKAFGVNNAAINLAGIIAAGFAIIVLALGSWRLSFIPLIFILAGLLLLAHIWSNEEYVVEPFDLHFVDSLKRVIVNNKVRKISLVAAIVAFVWNGALNFLPIFLETERGMSTGMANAAYATVFVIGVVITPITGAAGDRFDSVVTILATILVTIVGLILVISTDTTVAIILGVILFAVGLTGFWPVMTSYMMSVFPDGSKGGDYGIIGMFYMGAGSLGPSYVGVSGDYLNYTSAYTGLIICLLIATATIILLLRNGE